MERQGNLSINSDNIFPIIKKWLYSDQDIFIRELISNGCDAITKLKKLAVMGDYEEVEGEEYKIEVYASAKDKTLTFVDNGLGMTEEEVDKYINQIAFSGATDFINKYKDKAGDEQIIGHFGLGFYSAFMVAVGGNAYQIAVFVVNADRNGIIGNAVHREVHAERLSHVCHGGDHIQLVAGLHLLEEAVSLLVAHVLYKIIPLFGRQAVP